MKITRTRSENLTTRTRQNRKSYNELKEDVEFWKQKISASEKSITETETALKDTLNVSNLAGLVTYLHQQAGVVASLQEQVQAIADFVGYPPPEEEPEDPGASGQ